ncbi:UDP-N-acetylmuramoylalanyl-D-glutamate--2,6-diaminopimelate ligase [Halobacillus alkaliphilus]|uniref:UDP-N-acetylmuramoyl-L-alanyl-D-glutamate--2,6-diaminopimelate ligase n=1 Tax=Halobacillus alkaliphilus TaxID=396056 RepID=A0A1I2MS65_9BACI|nr:UDP-N-acetylmuramoyl-L-alanyl-D-glutamate--2,6-diaminopimelate ligase [Halobacillus alkaliphilus]SFF94253.1 UDP-N-acetylmuramoylalanyl-D-glutamate--2,6-diaminopimelate ligase [Halobacillus alkaliphilus]
MKMKKLLKLMPFYKVTQPLLDITVKGISMDSRSTGPGDLFICIHGVEADGHEYAQEAEAKGAAVIMAEREVTTSLPVVIVNDTVRALAMAASIFYGFPSEHLRVIGVTGTNGKTTVSYLLDEIFRNYNQRTGMIGTIQVSIAGKTYPVKNTTPDSLSLQRYFAEMRKAKVTTAIMEVSSHALDQGRVYGCDFDIAIFTNLTRDHLDYHDNFDDYLRAKSLLFAQLGNGYNKGRRKFAIINKDSKQAKRFIHSTSQSLLTYGIHSNADIMAKDIILGETGAAYSLETPKGEIAINSPLMGLFSVYNMLAAAGAAILSGIPLPVIKHAFETTRGVRGRFEPVREGQEYGVVIDYAHTPDSLQNALKTISEFCKGVTYVVVGCGGDRDRSKRSYMADAAIQGADHVIFTTDNPRSEDPKQIFQDMTGHLSNPFELIEDREQAIEYALRMAKAGDMVLIAGKGHETYQEVNGVRHPFDDSEVAKMILKRMKERPS